MRNLELFNDLVKDTKPSTRAIFFLYLSGLSVLEIQKLTVRLASIELEKKSYPMIIDTQYIFDGKKDGDIAFSFSNNRKLTPSRIRQIIDSIIIKTGKYNLEDIDKIRRVIL